MMAGRHSKQFVRGCQANFLTRPCGEPRKMPLLASRELPSDSTGLKLSPGSVIFLCGGPGCRSSNISAANAEPSLRSWSAPLNRPPIARNAEVPAWKSCYRSLRLSEERGPRPRRNPAPAARVAPRDAACVENRNRPWSVDRPFRLSTLNSQRPTLGHQNHP